MGEVALEIADGVSNSRWSELISMSRANSHIPTRTCVICRSKRPKNELLRLVKMPEGTVELDRSGRLNGRGAYICSNCDLLDDTRSNIQVHKSRLTTALKTEIDSSTLTRISKAISSQA